MAVELQHGGWVVELASIYFEGTVDVEVVWLDVHFVLVRRSFLVHNMVALRLVQILVAKLKAFDRTPAPDILVP